MPKYIFAIISETLFSAQRKPQIGKIFNNAPGQNRKAINPKLTSARGQAHRLMAGLQLEQSSEKDNSKDHIDDA